MQLIDVEPDSDLEDYAERLRDTTKEMWPHSNRVIQFNSGSAKNRWVIPHPITGKEEPYRQRSEHLSEEGPNSALDCKIAPDEFLGNLFIVSAEVFSEDGLDEGGSGPHVHSETFEGDELPDLD